MSSHDTRVVEMRFDNAQFEKGIKESMKTLDEFEKNLKFDKVERSLSGLEKSVNSVSFGGIKKGIDDVVTGFNALGIAGVMAMTKIASSIVNAGHQIATSFIEPMQSGFKEYETQINAVQTILTNTSSKGTTIDDVNKALDELNVYADKTIYNFTQMTDNIGRFTAAGVGLEDSVTAIKGISNLAAASGADSAQAARAMYNLSQAISMGKLQLMDWNSVVNAGMGGELFQESLKETARVHGVAVDEIIAKNGSFRDSLSEGWITSEILLETLSKFTGDLTEDQLKSLGYTEQQIEGIMDLGEKANEAATKVKTYTQLMDTLKEENQSGWTQSWETIIGDYEEAKKLWSDIAQITTGVISEQSQARNSFLESVFGGPSGLITADRWIEFMRDGKAAENSAFFDALQKTVEKSGISIDDLREKYGSFMAAVASGEVVTEKMVEDTINGVSQTSTQSLDQIKELVEQIENGFFGNGEERRRALEEAGYSYEALQALVDADWNGYGFGNLDWENLTEDQLRNLGVTEEQIVAFEELKKQMGVKGSDVDNLLGGSGLTGREMLVNSITNVVQAGADALHLFGEVWNEVFPPAGPEGIKNALEAIMDFTGQFQLFTRTYDEETGKLLNVEITDFGKKVKTIFTGIADGFGIIFDAISAVADFFKGIFESVFGEIFGDSEALNPIDFLVKYAEGISQLRDDLKSGEFIPKLIESIKNAINDLGEAARKVMDPIKALFTDGNGGISTAGKIGGVLGLLLAVMAPIIGRGLMGGGLVAGGGAGLLGLAAVGGIIGLLVSGLIGKDENGKSALDRLKEGDYGAFGIGEIIRGKFSGLGEAFRNLGDTLNFHPIDSIRNLFGSIRDSDIGQAIGGFVSNVKQKFTDFFSGIDFNPGEALSNIVNGITEFFSGIDINFDWFNGENGLLSKFGQVKDWIEGKLEGSPLDINFDWFNGEDGIVSKINQYIIEPLSNFEFDFSWFNGPNGLLSKFRQFKSWIEGKVTGSSLDINFDWFNGENGLVSLIQENVITPLSNIEFNFDWFNGEGGFLSKFGELKSWIEGKSEDEETSVNVDFGPITTLRNSIDDFFTWIGELGAKNKSGEDGTSVKNVLDEQFNNIKSSIEEFMSSDMVQKLMGVLEKFPLIMGLIAAGWASQGVRNFFSELGDSITDFLSRDQDGMTYAKFVAIAAGITALCTAIYEVRDLDMTNVGTGLAAIFGSLGALLTGNLLTSVIVTRLGSVLNIGQAISDLGLALAVEKMAEIIVKIRDANLTPEEIDKATQVMSQMSFFLSELGAFTGGGNLGVKLGKIVEVGGTVNGVDFSTGVGDLLIVQAIRLLVGIINEIKVNNISVSDSKNASEVIRPMTSILEELALLTSGFNAAVAAGAFGKYRGGGLQAMLGATGASAASGAGTLMYAKAIDICIDIISRVKDSRLTVDDAKEAEDILGGMVGSIQAMIILTDVVYELIGASGKARLWSAAGTTLTFNGVVYGINQLLSGLGHVDMEQLNPVALQNMRELLSAVKDILVEIFASVGVASILEYFTKAKVIALSLGLITTGIGMIVGGLGQMMTAVSELSSVYIENYDTINNSGKSLSEVVTESVGAMLDGLNSEENRGKIQEFAGFVSLIVTDTLPGLLTSLLSIPFQLGDAAVTMADFLIPENWLPNGDVAAEEVHGWLQAIIDGLVNGDNEETRERAKKYGASIMNGILTGFADAMVTHPIGAGIWDLLFNNFSIGHVFFDIPKSGDFIRGIDGHLLTDIYGAPLVLNTAIPIEVRDSGENITFTLADDSEAIVSGLEVLYNGNGYDNLYVNTETGQVYYDINAEGYAPTPDLVEEATKAMGEALADEVAKRYGQNEPITIDAEGLGITLDGTTSISIVSTELDESNLESDIEKMSLEGYVPKTIEVNDVPVEVRPSTMYILEPTENGNVNVWDEIGLKEVDITPAAASSYLDQGEILANQYAEGYINEMQNQGSNLEHATFVAFSGVNPKAASVLGVASPSWKAALLATYYVAGFAKGFIASIPTLNAPLLLMNASMQLVLKAFAPQFQQHGLDVTSNIAWGINIGGGTIASALYNMHSSMLIVLGNLSSGFREAGENFTAGLAIGIRSGTSMAIDAAAHVATMALNTAKNTLQEKSPSQATRLMGRFFSQGLGLGVRDDERFAIGSAQHLGNSMIDAMRTTARLVDAVMNDELNMTPTISPIIDMSNLQNANDLMNGAFRSRSVALAYNASMTTDGLVNPFDRLIERLDAKNDFGNTSIYMDGAVLNDDEEMRAVTLDFLYGLKRKAAL